MTAQVIRHLIRMARFHHKRFSITQFGDQLAFEHKQQMSFFTPMVSFVVGRVFYHTQAQAIVCPRAPMGFTGFPRMDCWGDGRPVGHLKRY